MEISAIERELNTTIELSEAQIAFFQKNNFIKIKEVLSPDTITHFNSFITAQVDAMNSEQSPLDQRDTYGKAFLQLFNLWEHNTDIQQRLKVADFEHVVEPFDAGELSFHSGWIFHRAGANTTQEMRKVMTVIYMDKAMRLKNPENDGQRNDWETWCPGAEVGNIIDTLKNPILD